MLKRCSSSDPKPNPSVKQNLAPNGHGIGLR